MTRFEELMADNIRRMNGNKQAALYHTFEAMITDRGLVSNPEFFLPPNEYDIVGGIADSVAGETALISASNCAYDSDVDWSEIEKLIGKGKNFLQSCTEYSSGFPSDLDVLRDNFTRLSRQNNLVETTLLVILCAGRVTDSDKMRARNSDLRTEIIDLNEFNGQSEVSSLNVNFLDFGELPELISARNNASDHKVHMGVIPGLTLAKLYDRFGIPLLDGNVRHFLGQVGPNKGIAQTIIDEPERFCSYNNGITVVAEGAEIVDGKLTSVDGISIVNGGQTSVSIFKAMKKGEDLSRIFVPMKFIVLTTENPHARKGLLEAISLYSNTQSKVNDADRMVNMTPHPELQEISEMEKMFSSGKGWYYERRRGEIRTKELTMDAVSFERWQLKFPPQKVIHASVIGIAWNAWWGSPHIGASGKNKGFFHYHNELTMRVAQNNWDAELHHKKTIGLSKLHNFTSDYMATTFSGLRSATLPHVLGWLSKLSENRLDLIDIWKMDELSGDLKKAITVLAKPVDRLIRNYQEDDQKQWAKSPTCTEAVWALSVPAGFTALNLKMMQDGQDVQGDPAEYVMDIGATKLWEMYRWGKANGVLFQGNAMLTNIIVRTVSRGKKPSEKQAGVILRAWTGCCAAGYDSTRDYPEYQR
jgi:hypothetical protein